MNGGPLHGRISVVLSGQKQFLSETCIAVINKEDALKQAFSLGHGKDEIMVIGGATVFEQFITDASRLNAAVFPFRQVVFIRK